MADVAACGRGRPNNLDAVRFGQVGCAHGHWRAQGRQQLHRARRGILGGDPARAGRNDVNGKSLGPGAEATIKAGEILTLETQGGGRFGGALERDCARVVRDVAEGLVSDSSARSACGWTGSP